MAFKIVYTPNPESSYETVDADSYEDKGGWIEFTRVRGGPGRKQVLMIRSGEVERIELIE